MKKLKNLTLIGTSHISIESVKLVEKVILEKKPDIVALELDQPRFFSLISGKKRKLSIKDIKNLGIKGFLINLIGAWIEKKLGELVGTPPGSEMIKAIESANKVKAKIALIDRDIRVTLKRLNKKITFKEKIHFLKDIIKGFIRRETVVKFDLRKVPNDEVIENLIKKVKKDYPSFYNVLIDERNKYMSKNLYKLMTLNKNIVAIVGAGHEKEMIAIIKKKFENEQPI